MTSWPYRWPVGSLKRYVRREVRKHRRENQALRERRDPFLYIVLAWILRGKVLLGIIAIYVILIAWPWPDPERVLPCWIIGSEATIADLRGILRTANGYFLMTQVSLIAVVFPIAVALVSLVTQRAHASSTNAHIRIYYTEALARPTGLSGIALAGVLASQMLLPAFLTYWPQGTSIIYWGGATSLTYWGQGTTADWLICEAALAVTNFLWLTVNAFAIGRFLSVSLAFIDPAGRALIRERFTANRSLPHHLKIDLFRIWYHVAHTLLLPHGGNDDDRIGVHFGGLWSSLSVGRIGVTKHIPRDSVLLDVWGRPLAFVVRRWWKRNLPESTKAHRTLGRKPLLIFPQEPFVPRSGPVIICQQRGSGLGFLERWIVRRAFRFGPQPFDETPEPKAILEELADEVMGQMDRVAIVGFNDTFRAMLDYHKFVLKAFATTDAFGQARSLSEIVGVWVPKHDEWLDPYRRLIERAVSMMDRDEDFVAMLAYVPSALMPSDLRAAPLAPVTALFALTRTTAARLEDWLARRPRHSADSRPDLLSLAGADQIIYSSALRRVVRAWMRVVERTDDYFKWSELPDSRGEEWHQLLKSWPLLWEHLHSSAWLMGIALWNNDPDGVKIYTESLLRWPGSLRHDLPFIGISEERLLTPQIFRSDWQLVEGFCDREYLSCREIFATAVANAWEDVIWGVAAIVLRWRLGGRPESELAKSAVKALYEGQSRDDHAPRSWVDSNRFQSLFFSLIRPVIAGGRFVEAGYAGELSKALSGIDQLSEPDHFPGSSFRPQRIHRRDDLRFCFEALLLASIASKSSDASMSRIDSYLDLIQDGLGDPGFGDLLSLLNDLRTDVTGESKEQVQTLLGEIADGIDYGEASSALIDYLEAWTKPINERREKHIRSCDLSAEKLEEIRRAVESALDDCCDDFSPFQPIIQRTREVLPRKTFHLSAVRKTDLVHGPLASSLSAFPEHVASRMQAFTKQLALREAFSERRERQALTPEAYRRILIGEACGLRKAGLTPVLLVHSRRNPTWIGEWLDAWSGKRASETRGGRILGRIEGIDVLQSRWPRVGTSLLVAGERLAEITHQEDDQGRIVTVIFEPDEQDPWQGTLRFEFGQKVILVDANPVELVFIEPEVGQE